MNIPTLSEARSAAIHITANAHDLMVSVQGKWTVIRAYLDSLPAAQVEQEIIVASLREQAAAADVDLAVARLEIAKLRHQLASGDFHTYRTNTFPQIRRDTHGRAVSGGTPVVGKVLGDQVCGCASCLGLGPTDQRHPGATAPAANYTNTGAAA